MVQGVIMRHKLTMSGGIIIMSMGGKSWLLACPRVYNHNHYCPMGDKGNWQGVFLINWNSPL